MSNNNKPPVDLSPLTYIAFWIGLFGFLIVVVLADKVWK